MNLTKREKTLVLVFVAVLVVGLAVLMKKPKMSQVEDEALKEPVVSTETSNKTTTLLQGDAIKQAATYTQLVQQYEGRRIQFGVYCDATPNNVTFKNGTKVMFDNRSGDQRYISVGGVVYNFPGYGYKVLTLSSNTLPKTLFLNCGSAVKVGQILLQK